jgi:hypothetical protein
MSDALLYSVRQLADELGLPESTVRYYRDTYSACASGAKPCGRLPGKS